MSSHHIVRENQEPALLVGYYQAIGSEYLGQLLEWSPTIITNSDNIDFFLAEGIKVDIFAGDITLIPHQEQLKHIPISSGFIYDALDYLIANNYKAVNILLDEVPIELLAYADRINIVCFANGKRYVLVKEYYEKWKPKGEQIFVNEENIKSFNGLDICAKHTFITVADGFFRIEFNHHDYMLVGEMI